MLPGVASKMKAEPARASTSTVARPVSGLTSLGTYLPHAEALVANPVALAEILPSSGAGKGHRAEEERKSKLEWYLPHSNQSTGKRPPGVGGDHKSHAKSDHDADGDDLDDDQPLERDVHDRRQRQRRANDDQPRDRDVAGITAEDVTRQRGGAQNPSRPQVREVHHHRQDEAPMFPKPVETGERRLARGQRVALDLHVQEELRHDAQHGPPEKDEARLRGDERPQDELARRQADACRDQARTNDAPETVRRIRKISDDEGG